jgi:hypothetical protein
VGSRSPSIAKKEVYAKMRPYEVLTIQDEFIHRYCMSRDDGGQKQRHRAKDGIPKLSVWQDSELSGKIPVPAESLARLPAG